MKILRLLVFTLIACTVPTFAQNPAQPKEWTPWVPVVNKWAEFLIITNLHGGNKTPEQLAKEDLKSLKVDCQIFGRISKNLPRELEGVDSFKILYTHYGKFRAMSDFNEDFVVVPNSGSGQSLQPVTITRPATEFDLAEASKPPSESELTTIVPPRITALVLGVEPSMKFKLRGHQYLVTGQWRRKGKTVEVKVNDYRPIPQTNPVPNP